MIPKIIHYCWFGGNELPDLYKGYIETWKKKCPDYKIIEWNENNFDVKSIPYVKEAYEIKKFAFVTDYVRLYVLSKYGGIYMDVDVEMLKNIDIFLTDDGFSGFENEKAVPTGIMGAKKGNPFINELLEEYNDIHFIDRNGNMDMTTNVERITQKAVLYGLKLNDKKQKICGFTFYPTEYFCPKSSRTLEMKITNNTYVIHHFSGSWNKGRANGVKKIIKRILPKFILKRIIYLIDRFK